MRERILSLVAVALALVALGLAALGAPPRSRAYWITKRPLAAGSRLVPSDLRRVLLGGAAPSGALSPSAPLPAGPLALDLPAGVIIGRSDFGHAVAAHRPTNVEVPIPVGSAGPGLTRGARAVVASFGGDEPPQVISTAASVVGVVGPTGEVTAIVALPLAEAEEALAALAAGKVAVLPWQP